MVYSLTYGEYRALIQNLLLLTYGASPILALFSPKSMVALLFLAALLNGKNIIASLRSKNIEREWFFIIPMIITALCSYFWSIDPSSTQRGMLQFLGIGVIALLFLQSSTITSLHKKALLFGFCLALSLLVLEWALNHPWRDFKHAYDALYIQSGLFLSLCLWPALHTLLFLRKYWAAGVLYLASISILGLIHSDSLVLSIVLAPLSALILARIRSQKILKTLSTSIVMIFLAAPWVYKEITHHISIEELNHYTKDSSYIHRFVIWKNAAEKITENPWIGHGFRSYRSLGFNSEKQPLAINNGKVEESLNVEPFGLHPHNIALQLYFELGILGALLGGLLTASLFLRCFSPEAKRERFIRLSFFTTSLIIFWISLGTFQNWWLSSIILLIAFLKQSPPEKTV